MTMGGAEESMTKRKMMQGLGALALALLLPLALAGCGAKARQAEDVANMSYEQLVEAAKGQTVSFYGWGGDEKLNQWLDDYYGKVLQEKYDIRLKRVPMDIDNILSQLSSEKQAGKENGVIDMIWINGENFKTARENDLLYGPFTDKLPNFKAFVDGEAAENRLDFAYEIGGFEAPYGKAQLVMETDTAVVEKLPRNLAEFEAFVQQYKGRVTYPALPDFTGSAFVRNVIYEACGGYEQFMNMEADKETVRKAVAPAMEYLVRLNPYLWNQGKSFPESSVAVKKMFADKELVFNVTYDAYNAPVSIADGSYPDTVRAFQFDKGTIGNTNYIAIAKNAPNKAAALVAVNEMLSPQVQADRYAKLKTIPVLDNARLSDEEKQLFEGVELGVGAIPQAELLAKRVPEMPSALVPIIEEIWQEEVVGK